MKPNPELHQLIQQMSPAEKGYFRKRARLKGIGLKTAYLDLFDLIAKQQVYDEAAVKKAFAGQAMVKQLAVAKFELFEKILKSLAAFQEKNDPRLQRQGRLGHVFLLQDRKLYGAALRLLKRTKKQAYLAEDYTLLLELVRKEVQLSKLTRAQQTGRPLEDLLQEERDIFALLQERMVLRQLYDEMFALISSSIEARETLVQQKATDILARTEAASQAGLQGFEAQVSYYFIHSYHARLMGDGAGLQSHLAALLQLWLAHPRQQKLQAKRFRSSIFYYLDSCLNSDKFEEFQQWRSLLNEVQTGARNEQVNEFRQSFHLDLRYSLVLLDRMQIASLAARLTKAQEKFGNTLEWAFVLPSYFNLMLLCFLTGEYRAAMAWNRKLLNAHTRTVRNDLLMAARLFECLLYFELGDADALENTLATSVRFFQRKGEGLELENLVVRYLRLLVRETGGREAVWEDFQKEMEALKKMNGGAVLGQTEILMWIEGKVAC